MSLLKLENVCIAFPVMHRWIRPSSNQLVLDHVDFTIEPGETWGLVGESGCGKSTLAQLMVGLLQPTQGRVLYQGQHIETLTPQGLLAFRRHTQMIFQDPDASLNSKHTIRSLLWEPFCIHKIHTMMDPEHTIDQLLDQVGLPFSAKDKYPFEFSGGQRQRICIARAIALKPSLLICDEPTSALDVSTQAQILNLLSDLRQELGIAYVFISHDLSIVRHFCSKIAIMHQGCIVDRRTRDDLFTDQAHPYTQTLFKIGLALE